MTSTNFAIELLEKMNAFCRLHSEYVLDDIKVVKEGEIIFRAGERPRGVYFICKGCVKVISTEDGNEALLTRLAGSNEMIGYVSMISETEYRSTAIAIRDSELQFIPKDIFIELLRSNVEFTNLMLQILCADIKEIKGNQLDYHKKNGKQRLAALLLSFDLA